MSLRYKGYKGKLWDVFTKYIKLRDFKKYGTCISCGKPKELWQLQGGHYAPAGNCGFALLFDETNVNAECGYCNGFDSGHLINYRNGLLNRYGEKTVLELEERYRDSHYRGKTTKTWNNKEYMAKIEEYKKKITDLEHEM